MPNVKNQETLVKIKEDLDGVSAMWVVDYCGLTVKDIQALRTAITGFNSQPYSSPHTMVSTSVQVAFRNPISASIGDRIAGRSVINKP